MGTRRPGFIRRFFGFIWDTISFLRGLVLNLLFLAVVVAIAAAWFIEDRPTVLENTALILDIKGPIVEQHTGTSSSLTLVQALADNVRETQLRDLLAVLDAAAKDPKIGRVVVLLDDLQGAGFATLREVAAAIERFRASGKQVIAWGAALDQRRYYIAAHADQILLHPFGRVLLQGFGGYRNYYRDALDTIGVTVHVFKVGQYKSFAEPFTQNEPSEAARADEAGLLNDLWAQYVSGIETARKLPAGSVTRLIDELPQRFAAVDGDAAKLALEEKLVDGLMTRDELRAMLTDRGVADTKRKSFRQIAFLEYLASLPERRHGDAVGVVVAAGEILDGEQPQGLVGGRSTAELIRRAREDSSIKAVLLRIDSPGGSVFGSELIRREMELTQKAGKPVLASYGDVAASGGYWISMAADEVIADPGAITGSIGVIAMIPSADKAFDKLSLHTHGTTTTWLAGALDPRRPLDPRVGDLLQASVTRNYKDFINMAATARNITPEQMNELAQGRVWSGRQAHEHGLVDRLGNFHEALQAAARRAGLDENFRVAYIERTPRGVDRLLGLLLNEAVSAFAAPLRALVPAAEIVPGAVRGIGGDLRWLRNAVRDPFTVQSHCLCSAKDLLGAD